MYGVIAIAFRSCLDRGEHAAMEKLEYLKAVFSEGAEGLGEKLESTDTDTLRTVTVAAGLSLRAGGKRRSVAELRSALAEHIASAPGADEEEDFCIASAPGSFTQRQFKPRTQRLVQA